MTFFMISQASGKTNHVTNIVSPAQIVTKNVQGLVKLPRIIKPKIFRSNPYRLSYFINHIEENDDIDIDDDYKITGPRKEDYGRVKAISTPDDPDGLITPDIEWKLFLIRQAALFKYRTQNIS